VTRLIIEYKGAKRIVAITTVGTHDGSIILSLVRAGSNTSEWKWDSTGSGFDSIEYSEQLPKTKRITIHASGRVNYHGSLNTQVNFIPCLLDLTEAMPIVIYVVPSIDALDIAGDSRAEDFVVDVISEWENSLTIAFSAIPSNLPPLLGEVHRLIVEGCYGLACAMFPGNALVIPDGVPAETFTTGRPMSPLTHQSMSEEQAFLRFQKLMQENQIRAATRAAEIPEDMHDQIVNEIVSAGRGIQGPNVEGVWEIVFQVPMRIRPLLVVRFSDPRYRAELIDMQPVDVRLERVRIRFRVFDEKERKWIKHPVEILDASLDAEL
jgi:hypothetical protein